MADKTISKLALAEQQLETAIALFISRKDRISAITLAGAADGILHGLVLKAGKQPFADYALSISEVISGETPAKAKFARHINDQLKINALKHMDEAENSEVTLDPDISAFGAITKAIANYSQLVPKHPPFIQVMLQWAWMFYDGEKITEDSPYVKPAGEKLMDWYANRADKMKDLEARMASHNRKKYGPDRN